MQDSIDALRQIPHVLSVELIDEGATDSSVDIASIQRLLEQQKEIESNWERWMCCLLFVQILNRLDQIKAECKFRCARHDP